MMMSLASASLALAAVLAVWLLPTLVFLFSTPLRGAEKLQWLLVIIALSWPAYAVYLFYIAFNRRRA